MDGKSLERIEAKLDAVLRLLQEQRSPPARYSLKHASEKLDVGKTKLREQIRAGTVLTVSDGTREYVPESEIRRMCTPKKHARNVVPLRGKQRRARAHSHAEGIRAALRKN